MPAPPHAVAAVILAGGFGTRLYDVLPELPKVLAPVRGRPFITFLLDQIRDAGIAQAVICTGHRADAVEQTLTSGRCGLRLVFSRENAPLGTGGALLQALDATSAEDLVVLNGDSIVDLDLGDFVHWCRAGEAAAALVARAVPDTSRYGCLDIAVDARVEAFHEKAAAAGPGMINAGVYFFRRHLLRALALPPPCSLERDILPLCCPRDLRAFACDAPFIDIGTPASYAAAEAFFADRRRRPAPANIPVARGRGPHRPINPKDGR